MNQTVTIRFAEAKDAELLARLGRETFHDAFVNNPLMPQDDLRLYLNSAFTVLQMTAEINDPKTLYFLAEVDGEAVGYAKLERNAAASGVTAKNPIKLKRLYCKQGVIGFGIGASLMKRCLEEAAEQNHDTIWLTVWQHNLRAQNFYRKWNFEECGTFDFMLGESLLTDKLMQRPVILGNSVGENNYEVVEYKRSY